MGVDFGSLGPCSLARPKWGGRLLGESISMQKYFTLGAVLYVGIGAFLALAVYLRGSDSAYTSDQNWFEALEVGLVWPWHVLKFMGVVA